MKDEKKFPGGLLVGETDKNGGKGIKIVAPEGNIITGGGELVLTSDTGKSKDIHEFDGKKMTPCEIASELNVAGGGVKIPCHIAEPANTTDSKMEVGDVIKKAAKGIRIKSQDEKLDDEYFGDIIRYINMSSVSDKYPDLKWYQIEDNKNLIRAERLKGTSHKQFVEYFVLPFIKETEERKAKETRGGIYSEELYSLLTFRNNKPYSEREKQRIAELESKIRSVNPNWDKGKWIKTGGLMDEGGYVIKKHNTMEDGGKAEDIKFNFKVGQEIQQISNDKSVMAEGIIIDRKISRSKYGDMPQYTIMWGNKNGIVTYSYPQENELHPTRYKVKKDFQGTELLRKDIDKGWDVYVALYRKKGDNEWRLGELVSNPGLSEKEALNTAQTQFIYDNPTKLEYPRQVKELYDWKVYKLSDENNMENGGNISTANEIKNQLGHKALYMLGAYDIFSDKGALVFKIRGSKKWKHIKIALNGKDLYDVTFTTWRGDKLNSKTVNDVYSDQLHKLIEEETGLYTHLDGGGKVNEDEITEMMWLLKNEGNQSFNASENIAIADELVTRGIAEKSGNEYGLTKSGEMRLMDRGGKTELYMGFPVKKSKYKLGDKVYSWQNKDYPAEIVRRHFAAWESVDKPHENDKWMYLVRLKNGQRSKWMSEPYLFKTQQKTYEEGGILDSESDKTEEKELEKHDNISSKKGIEIYLNKYSPIDVLSVSDRKKNATEQRKNIQDILKNKYLKHSIGIKNEMTQFDILFYTKGIEKLSHKAGLMKIDTLFQIEEIIQKGILYDVVPDRKGRKEILAILLFVVVIKYENELFEHRFTVKQYANGHFIYSSHADKRNPLLI